MDRKKSIGIILGYVLVIAETVVGILFTPILLHNLGNEEYGLYRLVVSWVSIISILDFGLGGTITRYVVKYRTNGDRKGESSFIGMAFIVYGVLSVAVLIVGIVASFFLPEISGSIKSSQYSEARLAFLILVLKTSVLLFNHAYTGWYTAYERFAFNRILAIGNITLRLCLVALLLPKRPTVYIVVLIDLILTICQLILNAVFSKKLLRTVPHLGKWNGSLFKEIMGFTLSLFLASVINQFNSNVDSIVLGMFSTTISVGLYSCALQIYTMYSSLSTTIQEVYLPAVSTVVFKNSSNKKVTEALIMPSRMQIVILLLALEGYILFGKDFLNLWIGHSYNPAEISICYVTGIILMASSTVQLFQNTTTCVLKAKNMLMGRVIITGISTIFNFVLTLLLVPHYGIIGAAIGTAISMIFGYGFAVNIYYRIHVGIDTRLYFKNSLAKLWYAEPLAFLSGVVIEVLLPTSNCFLFIKGFLFIILYMIRIGAFGLSKQEKNMFITKIKK